MYAARLWLKVPNAEREERVNRLITGLGLESTICAILHSLTYSRVLGAANTVVGTVFRKGLSGGQKRRLSLGVELIANPCMHTFICCVAVVTHSRKLSSSSMSRRVVSTLLPRITSSRCLSHCAPPEGRSFAPSISPARKVYIPFPHFCAFHVNFIVFHASDLLLLLSKGNEVYFGPSHEVVAHFSALGYPCPHETNPADHIRMHMHVCKDLFFNQVTILNTDFPGHGDLEQISNAFAQSQQMARLGTELAQLQAGNPLVEQEKPAGAIQAYPSRRISLIVLSSAI